MHWIVIGACEISLLPQVVLKHVVSRDFILKKFVHGTNSVSCLEWKSLWYCFISEFSMSFLHYCTFKEKISTCVSKMGHIILLCGSVGVNRYDLLSTLSTIYLLSKVPSTSYCSYSYSIAVVNLINASLYSHTRLLWGLPWILTVWY